MGPSFGEAGPAIAEEGWRGVLITLFSYYCKTVGLWVERGRQEDSCDIESGRTKHRVSRLVFIKDKILEGRVYGRVPS